MRTWVRVDYPYGGCQRKVPFVLLPSYGPDLFTSPHVEGFTTRSFFDSYTPCLPSVTPFVQDFCYTPFFRSFWAPTFSTLRCCRSLSLSSLLPLCRLRSLLQSPKGSEKSINASSVPSSLRTHMSRDDPTGPVRHDENRLNVGMEPKSDPSRLFVWVPIRTFIPGCCFKNYLKFLFRVSLLSTFTTLSLRSPVLKVQTQTLRLGKTQCRFKFLLQCNDECPLILISSKLLFTMYVVGPPTTSISPSPLFFSVRPFTLSSVPGTSYTLRLLRPLIRRSRPLLRCSLSSPILSFHEETQIGKKKKKKKKI